MKIQHKRSAALDGGKAKEPTALQTDLGELCVNFNTADPALFIRDNADNIVRVGGDLSLYQKVDEVGSAVFVCSPSDIDGQSPPAERLEGTLWWNTEAGVLYVWYEDADSSQWVIAVPQVGADEIPPGTTVGDTPPSPAQEGQMWWNSNDVDLGGGRLYVYYDNSWIDTSVPGGGGFSGDYNDLINKPNIPDGFDLEDGSEVNNLIVWRSAGEVTEAEVPPDSVDILNPSGSGVTYTDMPTTTNGSGTGLTVTYTAKDGSIVQNFKVGFPGSNYAPGDTFTVIDRGFGGTITKTSSSAGEHPGPDGESGWYPEVGSEYYVSTRRDSIVDSSPRFLGNTAFGLRPEGELIPEDGKVSHYSIGGRTHVQNSYITKGSFNHKHYKTADTDETAVINFEVSGGRLSDNVNPDKKGELKTQFKIADDVIAKVTEDVGFFIVQNMGTQGDLRFDPRHGLIQLTRSNSALNISSKNGKYNFRKEDGTTNGYQINAEAGSAGFVLAEDSANPANYDAEGEYIGPVQDRVADLIARVSAIESNEVADDAVDSALLTLVASLSQRLDQRDVQIAALTSRIAALEGA